MSTPNPLAGIPEGIDPAFTQQPPPKVSLPDIDDMGLDIFREFMDQNAYDTFVTLVHHFVHLQNVYEGKKIEWGSHMVHVGVSPFVGFGNAQLWRVAWLPNLEQNLLGIIMTFHSRSDKWKRENPMPWVFMERNAISFSSASRGYEAVKGINRILMDDNFLDKWKGHS